MHFEVLVEGQADRTALEVLLSKIIGPYNSPHTWRIHKHQGVGHLPADPLTKADPKNPSLLSNLPASLRAYGKSLTDNQAVIVLVDLDVEDCVTLKAALNNLLHYCSPTPKVLFRIAIEEVEAWFLGDRQAVIQAYPRARISALNTYQQDSICGTWELLADAVYPGGCRALKARGRQAAVEEKRRWARDIAPLMDVDENSSPSFRVFRDGVRRLAGE